LLSGLSLYHRSMKNIVKIITLLVGISALWFGLFKTSMVPRLQVAKLC
jgi:hypothetical protein